MASLLSPQEWSKAVKLGVGAITAIGVIIGSYLGVEGWADDKLSDLEIRMIQSQAEQDVRNEIQHNAIIQSERISKSEINIEITEIKIEEVQDDIDGRIEDGLEPTDRQRRSMDRLTKLLETYESEQKDATTKLTHISRTTVTTTTIITDDDQGDP